MLDKLYSSRTNFHAILLTGTSLFFLGIISRLNKLDLDLFHEMALFREALNMGTMPHYDLYSYIPTITPVVHHEWATGALLYFIVVQLGLGASGLMLLKYALTLFVLASCYRLAIRQGATTEIFSYLSFFIIILGWIGFTTIRAQLFTLCFLVILLWLIERDRRGNKYAIWALLPVFTMWLNMHAGFVTGIILLGLYIMELFIGKLLDGVSLHNTVYQLRGKLSLSVICCALPLLSPHGVDYYPYLWRAITLDRTDLIREWRPIWEISFIWVAVFTVTQLFIIYGLSQKGYKKLPGLLMLGASAWAAMSHCRHLSIYSVVFLCYAPAYLQGTTLGDLITNLWHKRKKFISILFITGGVFGLNHALHNEFWRLKIPTAYDETMKSRITYPAGAVAFLKSNQFAGNLLTPFHAGSYVSWNLYPNVKVSMDSRFEVAYPYEAVLEHYNFYNAKTGWQDMLSKYNTDALLIPNWSEVKPEIEKLMSGHDSALAKNWKQVYSDGAYSIYMKVDIAEHYPVVDLGEATVPGVFPYVIVERADLISKTK